ncbi:ribbon-helix-helix domain-containing protein [Metabacillus fastidiosus]|uniref:ribbon-helix-helix domain-containing protein n=1 Tax=Metabacillus fastidiosus TaxID=1458 RepID=UPI003D2D3685
MARPKKEPRESFGSTLRKDLIEELREVSDNTGMPISKLLDQAVELLIKDRNEKIYIDANIDEDNIEYVRIERTGSRDVVVPIQRNINREVAVSIEDEK